MSAQPEQAQRSAVVVNLGRFKLEPPVEEALELAWENAGGQPLSAAQLLEAAMAWGRDKRSRAFAKLSELLPVTVTAVRKRAPVAPLNRAAVPFEGPLAGSFFIAESFLAAERRVWGRDFVTLALLSRDDPSLEGLAGSAGRNVADVRDEWLDYLRVSDRHRAAEVWEQWWRAAAVPVAGGTETVEAPGVAYLMTWNPDLYPPSEMRPLAEQVETSGSAEFGWSTGTGAR